MMGQLVGQGAEEHVVQYGVGYGIYIVTGVMFNMVMGNWLFGVSVAVANLFIQPTYDFSVFGE